MPTNINGTTGVDKVQTGAVEIQDISATGTPNNTTFLRGDGSWQVIETTPTTSQVLAATAGAAYGAVGTYAYAAKSGNTNVIEGSTYAGSTLYPAGWESGGSVFVAADARISLIVTRGPTALSGTWRAIGRVNSGFYGTLVTLFLRIS
jgi:hypothetical protein